MRRFISCGMFLLIGAWTSVAMAQRSPGGISLGAAPSSGSTSRVRAENDRLSKPATPTRVLRIGPSKPQPQPPPTQNPGNDPPRDQHQDRGHSGQQHNGHGQNGNGHHAHGHEGRWNGGPWSGGNRGGGNRGGGNWIGGNWIGGNWIGGNWIGGYRGVTSWGWFGPVLPAVYPYFYTPNDFLYSTPVYNPTTVYSSPAVHSLPPQNASMVNLPAAPMPAASPADAIKTTNADRKALAGRFLSAGDAQFGKEKFLAALGRYKTAAETAPDMSEAYFRQAIAHVALEQYANAAKSFRRGLLVQSGARGTPVRLDTLYGANSVLKTNHLEEVAQAVEANPYDSDLLLVLGLELYFDGQLDRAGLCLSRVVQLQGDPDNLLSDYLPRPMPAGVATPQAVTTPGNKISF